MRSKVALRIWLAMVLAGGTLTSMECSEITKNSLKDGVFGYVTGSVSSQLSSAAVGDFILNLLLGQSSSSSLES